MKNILIVGGYGSVGLEISRMLSNVKEAHVIIAGRNKEKAESLAESLNADWRCIDLNNIYSIGEALTDVEIVINCFIDIIGNNFSLPNECIQNGIDYIDVAGVPASYHQEFLKLNDKAAEAGSTLITGLGLNPGMPGILLANNLNHFDDIDSSSIYFTMGSKIELSVLSLRGMAEMIKSKPLIWKNGQWTSPEIGYTKRYIDKPYNKNIFFGPGMITSDLFEIPQITNTKSITFWTGIESFRQYIRLLIGIKLGYTNSNQKAKKLLSALRKDGRNYSSDFNLTIITKGFNNRKAIQRTTRVIATEEYLTAVTPVIVCRQLIEGIISKKGAFLPPRIIDHQKFLECLKDYNVNLKDEFIMY